MKKYNKSSGKKLPQRFLKTAILKLLRKKSGKSYSSGNIKSKLKTKNSKDSVKSALTVLLSEKKILQDKDYQYRINPKFSDHSKRSNNGKEKILIGIVDLTSSGAAYILVEGQERDIYIPPKFVNGALQGDTVEVSAKPAYKNHRPQGKVKSILKRNRSVFVGTFQYFKKYGYVFVESLRMKIDIRILPKHFNDAQDGDAVVVEVIDFGSKARHEITGKIIDILDKDNRNDYEMNAILINSGFETSFSPEVMAESKQLTEQVSEQEISTRRDMREILTFTIDPHNAKDFDDAISYQKLENDVVEIGVHIADVTHFVRPGTALDKEAYSRATSVYLVDRVCPMLPERISNELCSLRPEEEKLCFSVIFRFAKNHQIADVWIGKTIIYSDRRFTYEEAQEVLEGNSVEYSEELLHINKIAHSLNKKRFKEGSINFDTNEVRFVLDEEAKPIDIISKTRKDAHKLIEEYMLLANQSVARYMSSKSKTPEVPYIYRIHDLPDPDRLMDLAMLASEFGIKLKFDTPKQITDSLNSLSENTEQEDIFNILKPMAIRCMAKAAYSADNIGHYGLGFEHYSHFTSPIRRYSDVIAHRILFKNLDREKRVDKKALIEQSLHISMKERDAIKAERESIKYKQVEYYTSKVGTETTGTIRNIIDRGLFIELVDSQADGFIPMDSLEERIVMHPSKIKITGSRSGTVWRIGDVVSVLIYDANLDKKQIDLRLVLEQEGQYT